MKAESGAGTVPGRPPGSPAQRRVAVATGARLQGYSIAVDGGASSLRLLAGGQPVAHAVRRIDRPDLRALAAVAFDAFETRRLAAGESATPHPPRDVRVGFFVEVDASAWQQATPEGRLWLALEIDGVADGSTVVLDARALGQWVRTLAGWRQPDEREVWRVLAHVAASKQFERLPKRAREWLDTAAQRRGLSSPFRGGDPAGRMASGARPRVGLAVVGPLSIAGWAFDPDGARPGFTIETDRGGWEGEPVWSERPELARELDAPHAAIGFTLVVPAVAWTHMDDTGHCALRIRLQGRLLAELVLDVAALRAESAELATVLPTGEPTARASLSRRLESLEAHATALLPAMGWTSDDAAALADLRAAHDAPPPPPPPLQSDAGLLAPTDGAATPPSTLRTHLEGWETLILHGWAADLEAGGEVFELSANGQVVECLLTRTNRVDVSRALGIAHEFPGFEIQLPSTVWRHVDADGVVSLVLRINGTPIVPEPLRLDDAAFERAVLGLLPAPDQKLPPLASSAGMRLRLTAVPLLLEHIEARGGLQRLSATARERLASVGERLALGRLVGALAPPLRPDEAAREALVLQRRVWRLQRLFNAALDRAGGLATPAILAPTLDRVLEDPDAEGPARVQFLLSLAPLFCNDAAFDRLARELPEEVLDLHAAGDDNWSVTIRIAFAAHAGRLDTAATRLQSVARAPTRGWINFECIALAVRAAIDDDAEDAAPLAARIALLRAFVTLLDALPGDFWSRLHDQALVDTAAYAIAADGPWPDDLADALVGATLRCHALVPRFWETLACATNERSVGLASDLRVTAAQADYVEIRDVWDRLDSTGLPVTRLADLVVRLHAADHRGQRDARQWMRELVLGVLAHAPATGERAAEVDGLLRLVADYFEPADLAAFARVPRSRLRALHDDPAIHLQQRARAARRGSIEAVDETEGRRWSDRLRRLAPALPERATSPCASTETAGAPPVHAPRAMACEATALEPALESPARASLWPTTQAPRVHDATGGNRLRLVSPPQRLALLDEARLLVVCVVRNERVMLPHFLAHHRGLGARAFVIVDNLSDDATRAFLADQPDVVLYAADTDYRDSHFGVAWQQAVLAAHGRGRWALLADADEFLLPGAPGPEALPTLLDTLEADGHDAARLLMIDLYPRDALRLVDFAEAGPAAAAGWMDRRPFVRWHLGGGLYTNGPTWLSALRHRLVPHSPPNAFTAQKTALLRWRPGVRLSEGLHYASGLHPAPRPLWFGHYKYHAGFRAKVVQEVERKQHFDGASEYAHYLHMVAEPDATLFDPALSAPLPVGAALDALEPGR